MIFKSIKWSIIGQSLIRYNYSIFYNINLKNEIKRRLKAALSNGRRNKKLQEL